MAPPSSSSRAKKWMHRVSKAILKSYSIRISPRYNLPIRYRPWFILFTCLIMVTLAILGFTNFPTPLPLNTKLLHFLSFGLGTGIFYWIVDVEESARRIWFWRRANLIFTIFICFFGGGIVSEIVQAMLPYKKFHIINVLINLCGSTVGLTISYHLEKYYRYRREINQIYRPVNPEYSEDEDDELSSAFLLPTHSPHLVPPKSAKGKNVRFADTPEREELFSVGEDSDEEEDHMPPSLPQDRGAPNNSLASSSTQAQDGDKKLVEGPKAEEGS